jgi:spermidine synthase
MSNRSASEAGIAPNRVLPALLALFVCSGACALIYEIVWFQLLELVIGSSAISLGVLLATFMGGMCIGSLLLPRVLPSGLHPLRVYALLEIGIGVCGLLALVTVPLVSHVYAAVAGHGFAAILLRAVICVICLLPPTILMGATLPVAARWVESTPEGVAWIGFLYGGNTVGAVFGSVLAGFYLLRVHDMTTATLVAFVINAAIAGLAFTISKRTADAPVRAPAKATRASMDAWPVYVTIALSGACALGAEVVWTRLLSLMLGATVYTFSLILGVFLTGLGLGSAVGAWLGRNASSPRLALGWCQLLQTGAVAIAALIIAKALPFWPVNPSLSPGPWFVFQLDLTRCVWPILVPAFLWGASFPLALAAASRGQDPARLVGGIYSANTVGAIIGALGFSLVLIPAFGTQHAQQILVVVSGISAMLMFASLLIPRLAQGTESRGSFRLGAAIPLGLTILLSVVAARGTPAVPGLLVAYGRYMVTWLNQVDIKYVGEGMNSSVAVSTLRSSGATQFHVSGKVEASTLPQDMRLQRMLAHLPALTSTKPRSVLVVGFGAGVTAGSFVPYPDVERIVICEIEPLIPEVVSTYFRKENNDVLNDKRTQVFYDDARSFILTTHEKFDVITSDPIHPWVKGAASLYTREYFEAVKAHLNPGGVVTQWVPLYESDANAVKSELATFLQVFPNGTIWANNLNGQGYDLVLLGSADSARIDINAMRERFADPRYAAVGESLSEVGFHSPVDLFSTYAGRGSDLTPWLANAVINRDRSLHLQYLAAAGLNRYESEGIYAEMERYRKFPEALFVADEGMLTRLRQAIR